MCGIAGIFSFQPQAEVKHELVKKAIGSLNRRGPDNNGLHSGPGVCLGHTRLQIIDISDLASQPFSDLSGRYTIIYNGEIYNFPELRSRLKQKGINFRSASDTEVLLYWMINKGPEGLEDLQGFFSFAFYDKQLHRLMIARDRFGIKPLFWYRDDNLIIFASEMKAIMEMQAPLDIDHASLELFLQLNYIPAPWSIFQNVSKLLPGHFITADNNGINVSRYYQLPVVSHADQGVPSYEQAKKMLYDKLQSAVQKRLIADVPIGSFLSGGIDSSIITALAAQQVKNLNTFSIGFSDEPMFDETRYARMVASKHSTNHTVFSLTTGDLLENLFQVLDYIDEPFADSSALAVHILCQQTRRKVTVALSGDGADEMFAGYNKHMAEYRVRHNRLLSMLPALAYPLLKQLPQSRNSAFANKVRQLSRFAEACSLPCHERYWQWASISSEKQVKDILALSNANSISEPRKQQILEALKSNCSFNQLLATDMHLVLANDMLTKVDMMSMANSLEVRVPFLDHDLVEFVFSLPYEYKIDSRRRKKILRDSFRDLLPQEVFNRNKQGFEVPLLRWLQGDLRSLIDQDLLGDEFINDQKIFNPATVKHLKAQLFSGNPGDSTSRVWALIVFQYWYKRTFK
jgi:asparagine synthase (glutamine-hydrolysing)